MIDFAADRAAMFADTCGFAVSATWMESGVPPGTAVRVMRSLPDTITEFGGARLAQPTMVIRVLVEDIPAPTKDDRFTIDDVTYIVQAAPIRDVDGRTWTLNLRPV